MRVPPTVDTDALARMLDSWAAQEEGVSVQMHIKGKGPYVTSLDERENKWWGILSRTLAPLAPKIETEIFPAATDCRYFRELGIPSFGFSPMRNTPILLHDHNESLAESVFLEGICVYEALIRALASATMEDFEPNASALQAVGAKGV